MLIRLATGSYALEERIQLDGSLTVSELTISADGDASISGPSQSSSRQLSGTDDGGLGGTPLLEINTLDQVRINLHGVVFEHSLNGPAIAVRGGQVWIDGCAFVRNEHSGALRVLGGTVRISNSRFEANSFLDGDGGALDATNGTLSLLNATFRANRAQRGGALHVSGAATRVNILHSQFTGNVATREGGAVAVDAATVTLGNQTSLVRNTAPVGASVTLHTGLAAYVLPAPLGHWIASTFTCRWYR